MNARMFRRPLMIEYKTPEQITLMRAAGLVVADVLARVSEAVAPGVSTADLDELAADVIRSHGAVPSFLGYHGYPAVLCTSVNNQITYDCVMAERVFTRALGATCASPVAAFCVLEDGDLRMRAQLFSEDGREMVEDRAVFDCGDDGTPAELARKLLAEAPESIRRLFAAG